MGQTTTAKTCALCGQDCSGKPRVKDPQGQYMCKECHEQATAGGGVATPAQRPPGKVAVADARTAAVAQGVRATAKPKPAPEPAGAFDSDDDGFLAGLSLGSSETSPCSSCGMPIAPAIVVCPSCGFNKETGKGPKKVKVSKDGPGAVEVAGAAANVLIFANPLVWLAAAAGAAALGTGIWYSIVANTGGQWRIAVLGIGVLVGLAVKLASGKYSGVFSGGIAVAATLVAICAGLYLNFQQAVAKVEKKYNIEEALTLTEDDLRVEYARQRAQAMESSGKTLAWADGADSDTAIGEWQFPPQVWRDAQAAWDKATPDWKAKFKADAESRVQGDYEDAKGDGFVYYVIFEERRGRQQFAIRSLIMFGGSLLAALWLGSGGALSGVTDAAGLRKE